MHDLSGLQPESVQQLKRTHRAGAREAMRWRPRFLKGLAMSCSITESLRAARVTFNTFKLHKQTDAEFLHQVEAAEEEGAELLHDVCFRNALEGTIEPVYWQGVQVGEIRKFPERLQIEMLRAYHKDRFVTPGTGKLSLNAGAGANVLVIGEAELSTLQDLRRQGLERMVEQKQQIREAQAREVSCVSQWGTPVRDLGCLAPRRAKGWRVTLAQ